MKILYYFMEQNTPMYQWQRIQFINELSYYNCKVEIFNPLQYSTIDEANEKLLEHLKGHPYDLFMTPHNHENLYISTLKEIKKKSIPTLLICFDNLLIPYFHKKVAPIYDLVWLTSKETVYLFESWGAKYVFLPYAANPFYFKPKFNEEIQKIGFIGTPYGTRTKRINALLENDITINLHANVLHNNVKQSINRKDLIKNFLIYSKFPIGRQLLLGNIATRFHKGIELKKTDSNLEIHPRTDTFAEMYELFSQYSLSLATTDARNTGVLKNPVQVVNLRSFEIPMAGGLQFSSYSNELANYFTEDKEIVFYRDEYELTEKANFYLNEKNADIRLRMKIAARHRAEKEHSWYQRFKYIFEYFNLNVRI